MNVPVKNLVVNRSWLTRMMGMAGIPVIQMPTHIPVVEYFLHPNKFNAKFGKLSYNAIQTINTGGKGGYDKVDDFKNLVKDIKANGIKTSLNGWDLGDKIELYGGHHRAAIAYALGIEQAPIHLLPLDPMIKLPRSKLATVRNAYDKVSKTESLKPGYSYNSFPSLKSIRKSLDRLKIIYADIIDCSGNNLTDLGCNDGFFGVTLSCHDFDVTFVDRSKAYLDVVREKLCALNRNIRIFHDNISNNILRKDFNPDVVIYMDVYYHTVLENGLNEANKQLQRILNCTNERLIFAPGRWDKLEKLGCTQKDLFEMLVKNSRQIKYLGHDFDKGYRREIYSIYK